MDSLSAECLINNNMHCSAQANLLASEVLQKLILDKEELTAERNQLATKQNQLAERLPALEENVAQMSELHTGLEKSEQYKMAHIKESSQLHKDLKEASQVG